MKRIVSGIPIFLLLMMIFTFSVVSLPMRAGSKDSGIVAVYGEDEATPKYGGTLRIGLALQLPGSLNPLVCNSGSGSIVLLTNVFGSLTRFNESGMVVPDLAENWEISADGCNYTFLLFQNVAWHDGFRFNASDVKYTFDEILSDPEVHASWRSYIQSCNLSSVEILDQFTVVFRLDSPDSAFLSIIGWIPIIPWHLYFGTDLATNPYNESPVGTGPFRFVGWTPGESIMLTADGEYRYNLGRPYLNEVMIVHYDNTTAMAEALMNNSIDMIPDTLDPNEIEHMHQLVGVSDVDLEIPNCWAVVLNYSNPILCDVRVREALSIAINRSEICKDAYLGYSTPAKGMVPPTLSYWINSELPDISCNRTLAEQLLDEAGYPRDITTGLRFNLTIRGPGSIAGSNWLRQACQDICDSWQDAGVNATMLTGSNWDTRFMHWFYDFNDLDNLNLLFCTNGLMNYGYSNATVDDLFEQGRTTFNMTLRKEIYDELQVLLSDDIPCICLWHDMSEAAYNNDFHGFKSPQSAALDSFYLERIWYDRTLSGEGNCPYRVCFTDSEGRRTGYYDGTAYEDILNSTYSGMDSDPQVVKIREPAGIYTVELFGTENASYKFEFTNIALEYKDVWIPEGFIHENETITYIVKVYGDGSIKVYDPDEFSPHDLGVRSISASKTVVGQDYTADLNAIVFNWGDYTEHFNITFYANTTVIGTVTDVVLLSGEPATKSFTWNTTSFAKGNYIINATIDVVPGEADISDNSATGGIVAVTIIGDVNADRKVDLKDVFAVGKAFGTTRSGPNPSGRVYVANCDINGDDKIDLKDYFTTCKNYGKSW